MKDAKRSEAMKAAWARRKADKALYAVTTEKQIAALKPILEEAHETIYGDREQTYGSPGKNLEAIAAYWTTYLRSKGLVVPEDSLTFDDVCNMMVLLKVARLGNTPLHRDSMVDACGYMALADRVARVSP